MDILLTRKSPEIQHIVEVNFTEVMHRRGGGLLGTKQGDMEDAIEEACRAQVRKVGEDMERRGKAGMVAVPEGEQGFWKGYWQSLIDKGQALKAAGEGK